MKRITVSSKTIGAYLFIITFLFLAGMSIGSFMLFIFCVFVFIPLLSIIELMFLCTNLKRFQYFSSEHPQKGDIVEYQLTLHNDTLFRASHIQLEFAMTFPDDDTVYEKEPLNITLKPGEKWTHQLSIRCEYRGVYLCGVKRITVSDSLGWIHYHQTEEHRTFHVYPRIIVLHDLPFVSRDTIHSSDMPSGSQKDYTLLNTLVPYRDGDTIKNIYWKKSALYGQPILKDYLHSSMENIEIYLDPRRNEPVSRAVLIREDSAIETAVALIRFFLVNSIPVSFHFMGHNRYDFKSSDFNDFVSFHKNTNNLYFESPVSAVACYLFDSQSQLISGASVLFITPSIDSAFFDIALKNSKSGKVIVVILNTAGMDLHQKETETSRLQILKQYGILGYVVHHSESLEKDLKN